MPTVSLTPPACRCVVFVSKMFAVPMSSLPDAAAAFPAAAAAGPAGAVAAVGGLPGDAAESDSTPGASCAAASASPGGGFPASLRPVLESAWWGMPRGASPATIDLRGVGASRDAVVAGLRRRQQARRNASAAAAGSAEESRQLAQQSEAAAAIPGFGDDDAGAVETFIAFARVFSGTLRPGESLSGELHSVSRASPFLLLADTPVFVLGPKYDPSDPGAAGAAHISLVDAPLPLYLMMGRELFPVSASMCFNSVGSTHFLIVLSRSPSPPPATSSASGAWAATCSRRRRSALHPRASAWLR